MKMKVKKRFNLKVRGKLIYNTIYTVTVTRF